jgi:hypothetical protein
VKINISFELEMNDKQMSAWANEYGLDMEDVASDATGHLGSLIREHVKNLYHVEEFASLKNYQVR